MAVRVQTMLVSTYPLVKQTTLSQKLYKSPFRASGNSLALNCGKCSLASGDVTNRDPGKGASAFLLRLSVSALGRPLQSWSSVSGPVGAPLASLTWRLVQDVAQPEGRCGVGGSGLEGALPALVGGGKS